MVLLVQTSKSVVIANIQLQCEPKLPFLSVGLRYVLIQLDSRVALRRNNLLIRIVFF